MEELSPEMVELAPRWVVGIRTKMTLANNTTPQLWQSFMPRRFEIAKRQDEMYLSINIYSGTDPGIFSPDTAFEKWAAVEVADVDSIPEGTEAFRMEGGRYAVFHHKGPASAAPLIFGKIFGVWLPQSGYTLADRPHFEVLAEGYDPMDPAAEEDIWIPIDDAGSR